MEITKLCCPSCGAGIDMDVQGRKAVFCPFCGGQFLIDDGSININQNINIHERYTDDAAVEREKRLGKKDKDRDEKFYAILGLIMLIIIYGFAYLIGR